MFRIRKQFTFEAAHQLEGAFSRVCVDCIHGHTYTVEMFITAEQLDENEMVVDFGILKEFKQFVNDQWDHALLLNVNKQAAYAPLVEQGLLKKVRWFKRNVTAEMMAQFLYTDLVGFLRVKKPSVRVEKIRIHETQTGWAEYGE